MLKFFETYNPVIQGVAAIFALAGGVIAVLIYLINKFQIYKSKNKELCYLLRSFEVNHLNNLKNYGLIPQDQDTVAASELNKKYFSRELISNDVLKEYPGTHESMNEIIITWKFINLWKWVFRILSTLSIIAILILIKIFICS